MQSTDESNKTRDQCDCSGEHQPREGRLALPPRNLRHAANEDCAKGAGASEGWSDTVKETGRMDGRKIYRRVSCLVMFDSEALAFSSHWHVNTSESFLLRTFATRKHVSSQFQVELARRAPI